MTATAISSVTEIVAKCMEIGLEHFPQGVPHTWGRYQWADAYDYFYGFYGRGGLYPASVPNPTMQEFKPAVLADFEAAITGETEHPLFSGQGWEWASVERERVRDRIRLSREQKPIGYFCVKGHEPAGWPQAATPSPIS